jgi:hypothetical protein
MRKQYKNDTVLDKNDDGDYEVVSERLWLQSQSWKFQVIVKMPGHPVPRKFRVRIKRNAYDDQSHAKVEVWANNKWESVSSMPIQDCKCAVISYVVRREDFGIGLFREDARTLLQEAKQIVY